VRVFPSFSFLLCAFQCSFSVIRKFPISYKRIGIQDTPLRDTGTCTYTIEDYLLVRYVQNISSSCIGIAFKYYYCTAKAYRVVVPVQYKVHTADGRHTRGAPITKEIER
jgi:hypothetical protein